MRQRRAWKRGSARREAVDRRSSFRVIWTQRPISPSHELVVRREADLAANLVELARLAEHPAQPLRQGERAHRKHQEGIALLNGAGGQGDDLVSEPGGRCRGRTRTGLYPTS